MAGMTEKNRLTMADGITMESSIGELYRTPVGHDALAKVLLQLGLPEGLITNGLVSGLKLKTVVRGA